MSGDVIELCPADELRRLAQAIFRDAKARIQRVLPLAQVIHTGGTSVPGAVTKGDVDIHVRVGAGEFAAARAELSALFETYRPEIWKEGFAAFVDTGETRLPTGIALTAVGSEHDVRFARAWKRLACEPALLREYNAIKLRYQGTRRHDEYRAAKSAFFTRLAGPET